MLTNVIALLRGLRKLGFHVGVDETRQVLAALRAVGVRDEQVCQYAVQAVVVKHPEEIALFQVAWGQFWYFLTRGPHPWLTNNTLWAHVLQRRSQRHRHPQVIWMGANQREAPPDTARDESDATEIRCKTGANRAEVLAHTDFAQLTELEKNELLRTRISFGAPMYRSHRWEETRHGRNVDLNRTLRKGVQQGEWLELLKRRRREKPRPVVVLLDVSGSMDPYSRMILRFVHLLARANVPVEAFTLGTRLHHVTRILKLREMEGVLAQLSERVPDFSGGTRIAECLSAFNRGWSKRVFRRRAVLILATDGLDSGSEQELERELGLLSRFAGRLVWWNPNLRDPRFLPTARGTAVFYRSVDEMWPVSSWVHLEQFWASWTQTKTSPRRFSR